MVVSGRPRLERMCEQCLVCRFSVETAVLIAIYDLVCVCVCVCAWESYFSNRYNNYTKNETIRQHNTPGRTIFSKEK